MYMMSAQIARSVAKDLIKYNDDYQYRELMDCVEGAIKIAIAKEHFYTSVVCCLSDEICALVVSDLCDLGYLAEWEDHQFWKRINICWK